MGVSKLFHSLIIRVFINNIASGLSEILETDLNYLYLMIAFLSPYNNS